MSVSLIEATDASEDSWPAVAPALVPGRALFILISFEGPDPYSCAGGLGTRVSRLAETLASQGYETHLFFVGDPRLPGEERIIGGKLVLHRWAQWLSAQHGNGVYDGEDEKVQEFTRSLPWFIARNVAIPALEQGMVPVVLSEEWQTAQTAIELSDALHQLQARDRALLFWNANNPYSFDRIDWPRLAFTNTITAVSRYMRSIIRARGVDALVIPNGIPARLIRQSTTTAARELRASVAGSSLYFKMARWEPEKGWSQALDAILALRWRGRRSTLVARSGGPSGGRDGLHADALARGLRSVEIHRPEAALRSLVEAVRAGAEVVSFRFGVDESLASTLFEASDGVLANSVSEPFGLVGLEAMAAGGLVYTGGTGEDYAVSGRNAVVLETLDAHEIADHAEQLDRAPERAAGIRRAARRTARDYTWERVSTLLMQRAEQLARRQRIAPANSSNRQNREVEDARPLQPA